MTADAGVRKARRERDTAKRRIGNASPDLPKRSSRSSVGVLRPQTLPGMPIFF